MSQLSRGGQLLVFGEEQRTLGVLLGGRIISAVATLNPFADEGRAVALHNLGTMDDVEVDEGEGVDEEIN